MSLIGPSSASFLLSWRIRMSVVTLCGQVVLTRAEPKAGMHDNMTNACRKLRSFGTSFTRHSLRRRRTCLTKSCCGHCSEPREVSLASMAFTTLYYAHNCRLSS